MNRLIIIGNGFDLAHGYKTGYQHFLFHILFKELLVFRDELKSKTHDQKKAKHYFYFEAIKNQTYYLGISNAISELEDKLEKEEYNEFEELKKFINSNQGYFRIMIVSSLISKLYSDLSIKNWVDVEETYYTLLKSFEKNKTGLTFRDGDLKQIEMLNKDLSFLTKELEKYLKVAVERPSFIEDMENIFKKDAYAETKILNFNYTDTYVQYLEGLNSIKRIDIHGQLNSGSNPIIFGVGDENHSLYSRIVEANVDEMLINVKSLKYLETYNYEKLKFELGQGEFIIDVIGHSCGISDRTLLKEVFTHGDCNNINIYHHNGIESYRSSIYGASRYFKSNFEMRQKIEPFNYEFTIPQQSES
ncbi:MAG: AbiH family protein [Vicingaceae bacterium]|nr:AbiH family protein [Vicingaceae bacterium]